MTDDYEKTLYRGCYPQSKQYLGAEKANEYCTCMVKTLSNKYSNEDMDNIYKLPEAEQIKVYDEVSNFCVITLEISEDKEDKGNDLDKSENN